MIVKEEINGTEIVCETGEYYFIFLSEKRLARVEKPKKNTQTMSKKLQRKYGKK